jgi:exodeoxyribonuclease V alpha subunit
MHSPHVEWLQRRWSLPEHRIALVERLLTAQESGNTACECLAGEVDGAWGTALAEAASLPQTPEAACPLVHVVTGGKSFLQSWRHFQAERCIAENLLARCGSADAGNTPDAFDSEQALRQLFPCHLAEDRQVAATRTALTRPLALITGGPGTGKTYTLARILTLLLMRAAHTGGTPPRIRLAAPTGKAAERMKEAVEASINGLPSHFATHADDLLRAAATSSTLHSLLGYNPSEAACRFDASHPLPCEVLIIDEASMIDVLLWKALLDAMPRSAACKLIILGDPFQLESVGAGDVLYQLVQAPALQPIHVRLTQSRRFANRPDIQSLANAVVSGRARDIETLLDACKNPLAPRGLAWLGDVPHQAVWGSLPQHLIESLKAVAFADTPETALQALGRIRLLTAHRESSLGATGLGDTLTRELSRLRPAGARRINEPVIINVNDPETGLRNGSVGILCTDARGERRAWFPAARDTDPPRNLALGRLPDTSLAWALTIHRSQGSEFDDVVVVLPREESPLATRELLYTAITRARNSVTLLGARETIIKAVTDPARRITLLGWRLRS